VIIFAGNADNGRDSGGCVKKSGVDWDLIRVISPEINGIYLCRTVNSADFNPEFGVAPREYGSFFVHPGGKAHCFGSPQGRLLNTGW
jgi:hypothetical protein